MTRSLVNHLLRQTRPSTGAVSGHEILVRIHEAFIEFYQRHQPNIEISFDRWRFGVERTYEPVEDFIIFMNHNPSPSSNPNNPNPNNPNNPNNDFELVIRARINSSEIRTVFKFRSDEIQGYEFQLSTQVGLTTFDHRSVYLRTTNPSNDNDNDNDD